MKTTLKVTALLILLTAFLFAACSPTSGDSEDPPTSYTVTYNANGATSGNVPVDPSRFMQGQTILVLGNTGNLARTGHTFAGWCLDPAGTGTTYTAGQTLTMGNANVIFYAKWTQNPTYAVSYDGNGNTGGEVPVDSTRYEEGATVMVLGNAGDLVKTHGGLSLVLFGWNTQLDGGGTTYTAGETFLMGAADVVLYAVWLLPYILPDSAIDVSLGAKSVLVDGSKAYIIEGTTCKVLDVSDPLSPSLLGTVTHGYTDLRVEPQAIFSNIVWCVRSSSGGFGQATYVFGVDVSDPANPVMRGSLTLQPWSSLLSSVSFIHAGYWLVHDYSRNLIYVIDIGDPDAPALYSQWGVPNMVNGGPGTMMIEGTLMYLPCGENATFRIYDLADLAAVYQTGVVSTGWEAYGTVVKIGSRAYMTTQANMTVIDVSDPATPVVVGTVAFTGYLKEKNGRLFSFGVSSPTISAYSLTDPVNPVVESSSTVPAPPPSSSLTLYTLAYPSAAWVGNYLIGMTYGSAAAYHGARALSFTVN